VQCAPSKLVPAKEESYNHGARTYRVGQDKKLYITLGQPHNVQPRDKVKLNEEIGMSGIVRMETEGMSDAIPNGKINRSEATAPRSVAQCVMCHGVFGLSVTPDAPHLANQPRIYLVAQLKAFRSGSRQHAVMNVIAKPLTDDDIDAAADWFNKVGIETVKP